MKAAVDAVMADIRRMLEEEHDRTLDIEKRILMSSPALSGLRLETAKPSRFELGIAHARQWAMFREWLNHKTEDYHGGW